VSSQPPRAMRSSRGSLPWGYATVMQSTISARPSGNRNCSVFRADDRCHQRQPNPSGH
jgi:hypothetical protein